MKKFALMMLGLSAALPLHAQDSGTTPPPDAASTSPTPPADNAQQLPAGNASGGAPADNSAAAAPPAESSTPPATTDASSAPAAPADNSAAAAPAPTDASTSAAPADNSAAAPAPTEAAPASTEAAAPASTESAPATGEAAPATGEAAAPAATEAAPAAAESTPASTESTPTVEATPTEGAPAEASAAPSEHKPWIFYAGADYGSVKVSFSDNSGGADFSNKIWQARLGMRITDAIGAEFHYGKGLKDDNTPNQPMMDATYGVYLVPTGTLLDVVEFGFPLGFSWTKLKSGDASTTEDGVSYGMNIEFPFKLVWDALPDIRIGGGGMVYQQNNNARTYGWHAGLRLDFAI